LTTYKKNESFVLEQTKHKDFYLFFKQSFVVLEAFQDDMCSTFVQRQTNAMQNE
jgi:hypothetical protein